MKALTGFIDASDTPLAMLFGQKPRIPPRNSDVTELWVEKEGVIGDKSLYLLAPWTSAFNAQGQSNNNGHVALALPGGQPKNADHVKLEDVNFCNGVTSPKICGAFDAKRAYQLAPGHANNLYLVFATDYKKSKFLAYDSAQVHSLVFSVAAIPTEVVMTYKQKIEGIAFKRRRLGLGHRL